MLIIKRVMTKNTIKSMLKKIRSTFHLGSFSPIPLCFSITLLTLITSALFVSYLDSDLVSLNHIFYVLQPKSIASYILYKTGFSELIKFICDIFSQLYMPIDNSVLKPIFHFITGDGGILPGPEVIREQISLLEFQYSVANDWFDHYTGIANNFTSQGETEAASMAQESADTWGGRMSSLSGQISDLNAELRDLEG